MFGWFQGLVLLGAAAFAGCGAQEYVRVAPAGKSRGDTGITYADLDEAAKAACAWIWAHKPRAETQEYCGVLFQEGIDPAIRVGLPEEGGHIWGCTPSEPPPPMRTVGRYHNHRFDAEPSGQDRITAAALPMLSHYLCGPSKLVRRISATEGTVNVP